MPRRRTSLRTVRPSIRTRRTSELPLYCPSHSARLPPLCAAAPRATCMYASRTLNLRLAFTWLSPVPTWPSLYPPGRPADAAPPPAGLPVAQGLGAHASGRWLQPQGSAGLGPAADWPGVPLVGSPTSGRNSGGEWNAGGGDRCELGQLRVSSSLQAGLRGSGEQKPGLQVGRTGGWAWGLTWRWAWMGQHPCSCSVAVFCVSYM
jgi:hypothetical protein